MPRIAKFCKYLPDYGWTPVLLTVDWHNVEHQYATTNAADPCEVIRVPNRSARRDLKRKAVCVLNYCVKWFRTIDDVVYSPDEKNLYKMGRELCKTRGFDVILASSFPQCVHRVARKLSNEFMIPWVADHRDIYGQAKNHFRGLRAWAAERDRIVGSWQDRENAKSAAEIVTVSEGLADRLRKRTGREINVIMNGYDDDDFGMAINNQIANDRMTIVYAGSFFGDSTLHIFMDGIERLLAKYPYIRDKIVIEFYGPCCFEYRDKIGADQLERIGKIIEWKGIVSHQESIQIISRADALYFVSHPAKGIVTGKIFEYLRSGRPIISVPGDGDITDEILKRSGAGKTASTLESVEGLLKKWFDEWQEQGEIYQTRDEEYISQFSRRNLTGRLAGLLEELLAPESGQPGALL